MSKFYAPSRSVRRVGRLQNQRAEGTGPKLIQSPTLDPKETPPALFAHYDQLDPDLKAELPLKRIWTVAAQEEEF